MKKVAAIALLATMMIAPFGIRADFGNRASETPECCQKKQGCCPSASCCTGGNHAMARIARFTLPKADPEKIRGALTFSNITGNSCVR